MNILLGVILILSILINFFLYYQGVKLTDKSDYKLNDLKYKVEAYEKTLDENKRKEEKLKIELQEKNNYINQLINNQRNQSNNNIQFQLNSLKNQLEKEKEQTLIYKNKWEKNKIEYSNIYPYKRAYQSEKQNLKTCNSNLSNLKFDYQKLSLYYATKRCY